MRQHFYRNLCLRVAAALFITIALSFTASSPALALDLNPEDYFQITFNPTTFDKNAVAAGESFRAVIKGRAACIKDLPLPISEISITTKVIARPAAGGIDLTLNPQYVISIKPLPNKTGETFDISQTVALQFPAGTAPGDYTVIGKLSEAKVKVLVWIDVTGSFPQEQTMGAVKCIVPSTAPAPSQTAGTTTPPPTTAPVITTAPTTTPPSATQPVGGSTYLPGSSAPPIEKLPFTTIVIIALLVVVAVLLIIVILLLRRRGG